MAQSGIYQILNTVNGKRYIGSAINLGKRRSNHFSDLKRSAHTNSHLQHAYNKYGGRAFVFEELIYVPPSWLTIIEQLFMDWRKPEYNKTKIAENCLGVKHSIETRNKISEANRKRGCSLETRKRISAAQKGRVNRGVLKGSRKGAHIRWHTNRGITSPDCELCGGE